MLEEGGRGEGCVCTLPRAAGTRASVRNVVPLLVTVTSAHAARSTVGALYYAPDARARCNARASSEYTLRDVPRIYSYYTRRLGVRASPREKLEISAGRHRDGDDALRLGIRHYVAHVLENALER